MAASAHIQAPERRPAKAKSTSYATVEEFIKNTGFPCVGAKTALSKGQVTVIAADSLESNRDDQFILEAIYRFIAAYAADQSLFRSLIVEFSGPTRLSEEAYERHLWQRLQALHELDRERFGWDQAVGSDPDAKDFSFSLGGKGFYLVGLHPGSSRPARRFSKPAVVFNLHEQFERLREDGSYQTMRNLIRRRDQAFSGSVNPMLADFGSRSEARQYSGRQVDGEWQCPFHSKH